MAPVDGIKLVKKRTAAKQVKPQPQPVVPEKPRSTREIPAEPKRQLLWILVTIVMVGVFIGWIFLFKSNALFGKSGRVSTAWLKIQGSVESLIETFKEDVLRIQKPTTNQGMSEQEKIKELEERLFPEFTNKQ